MADFSSSSSSSSSSTAALTDTAAISAASSSAVFDDGTEDSCSICLEPFSADDPATITSCKHEYHLHCILEWSQRSKECPICWQVFVLKDPASQELLNAVEAEKQFRTRNLYSSSFNNSHSPLQRLNIEQDDSCSDDSDFDEQIMQHLVAAASRAHYFQRENERSSGAGPSEILVYNSSVHMYGVQPTVSTYPTGGSAATSVVSSSTDIQPSPPASSPVVDVSARNGSAESDVPFKPRVLYSQPPPENVKRLNSSEMFSFPESIKSKFSAASARYKETLSKGTRGLKEKLLAQNASVKELSKGVQREMNAGIAGVARMIERLDLTSKRVSAAAPIPCPTVATSSFLLKGKKIQENNVGQSLTDEGGVLVHDASSNASSISIPVSDQVEIPPCVQTRNDAVKT